MATVAFIDRYYDEEPSWVGRTRHWYGHDEPAEWCASVDHQANKDGQAPFEERWFDEVDTAIKWARRRSAIVLVRLGSSEAEVYSAGPTRANQRFDGTATDYLEWPPDNWPEYAGPAAERRKFHSTDVTQPLPEQAYVPTPRFSYRFIALEPDDEPGSNFERSVTVRQQLQIGDQIWFPTQGFDTWTVVELTNEPEASSIDPYAGALGVGSSGTVACQGLTPSVEVSDLS